MHSSVVSVGPPEASGRAEHRTATGRPGRPSRPRTPGRSIQSASSASASRPGSLVERVAGDEFPVPLPGADEGAVRARVDGLGRRLDGGLPVGASVGGAAWGRHMPGPEDLPEAADRRL